MRGFLAKYMLYVYLNYIKDDLDVYKDFIQPFIKILWFINGVYMWMFSIILFPIFYLDMFWLDNKDEFNNKILAIIEESENIERDER